MAQNLTSSFYKQINPYDNGLSNTVEEDPVEVYSIKYSSDTGFMFLNYFVVVLLFVLIGVILHG